MEPLEALRRAVIMIVLLCLLMKVLYMDCNWRWMCNSTRIYHFLTKILVSRHV